MPKKIQHPHALPTQVEERLALWGQAIRKQRHQQKIRAADLSARMEVAETTLRRIERGDPGASASLYLTAFHILGLLNEAAPMLAPAAYAGTEGRRVGRPAGEVDLGYF